MSSINADTAPYDAAVIDVGSNSVRLVLYRIEGRAVWTVHNEKVLAGLGRDLATTGRLNRKGVATALTALRRFNAIVERNPAAKVHVAATAAVREAADGGDFCRAVQDSCGLSPRVVSGGEEARLSALGVIGGAPDTRGLVGDLGGASLELVPVKNGRIADGVTLPLGPFGIPPEAKASPEATRAFLDKKLGKLKSRFGRDELNVVGGAWRTLAHLHMRLRAYPLEILHQYSFDAREIEETIAFAVRQSAASLASIEGFSRRRTETLPHAALVMEGLVRNLGVQRVTVSAFGLREGLLFDAMPPEVFARDPLIDGAAALGGRRELAEVLGANLQAWLGPVIRRLPPLFHGRDTALIAAACRLAELGSQMHPDHRADLIFDQVLRAPIPGVNHVERVFLAATLFSRHTASNNIRDPEVVGRLLDRPRLDRARAIGALIRLGCDLSGKNGAILADAPIAVADNRLRLAAADDRSEALMGEQVAKRLSFAATRLGLATETKVKS
jgi:exopolyphosphatase / guanosine-5'-triphosphate,3'-diphosphate pyrophosphatase